MPVSLIPAFLFYCYTNGITPGPANLCSLSAAMNYGRKQALIQWRGLIIGFWIDAMIAVLINGVLGAALGKYVGYLSYVGAAYILWLAIKILRTSYDHVGDEQEAAANCNFRTGLIVQLTNAKVILFCITALASYVTPYTNSLLTLFLVGCFLPLTGPICNLAWLFAGDRLRGLFLKYPRPLNIIMAIALVLCAISLVRH